MHRCFALGCKDETQMSFCQKHWNMIPESLGRVITRHFHKSGIDSKEYKLWVNHGVNHIKAMEAK